MLIVILRVAKRSRRIQTLHGFRDCARNDGEPRSFIAWSGNGIKNRLARRRGEKKLSFCAKARRTDSLSRLREGSP